MRGSHITYAFLYYISVTSSSIASESGLAHTSPWSGFNICRDFIDKHVRRRHMRSDQQNVSLNYFHSYAVKDRVNLHDVSDVAPANPPTVSDVLKVVLPTESDDGIIRDEFASLLARMVCDNMHYFKENYVDIVQRHIPHKYEIEMSSKSQVVSVHLILYICRYTCNTNVQS